MNRYEFDYGASIIELINADVKAISEIVEARNEWCSDESDLLIAERDAEFIAKVVGILAKYGL